MSVELCLLWNVNMIEWASKRRESRRAGEWIERGVMAYCDGRVPVPVPERMWIEIAIAINSKINKSKGEGLKR